LSSVELTAEEEEYIKNKFGDIELSESEESSESSEGGQEDSDKLNNQHLVNSNKVVSSNKQCKAAIKDPYSPGKLHQKAFLIKLSVCNYYTYKAMKTQITIHFYNPRLV
jgi:hypothetical protein